jgi:hypothetical protein
MAIKRCVCDHEWQDKTYGSKNRVANEMNKAQGTGFRCTVCGKEIVSTISKKGK